MRVVKTQKRVHILAGSGSRSVTSVTSNDFNFAGDGLDDGDDDV